MKQKVRYSLAENGIDSITHGIDHFLQGEKDTKNYKYAILHIFHGVEMILKEKLLRINPILIYSNIDKEIKEDHHTVGFERLYIRLKNTGIELGESDCKIIQRIQKIRNQIEHKETVIEIEDAKFIIGRSIEFLIKFMRKELKMELKKTIDTDRYKILVNMIDFYDEKVKIVEGEINHDIAGIDPKERSSVDVVFCPLCDERTVIVKECENEVTCHFCGESFLVYYCDRCSIPILLQSETETPIFCDVCKDDLFGV